MKTKKINEQKKFDWLVWPQTYFDMAIIGCDWLIKELSQYSSNLKNHESKQSSDYVILPIVHNFKHGIELYLKSLGGLWDKEYATTHDLVFLLNAVISKIEKISKNQNKIMEIFDTEVRSIIEKYYFGLYLPKIKFRNRPDIKNEAERYPETENAYEIPEFFIFDKNKNVVNLINEQLVEEIKADVKSLHDIFRGIANDKIFEKI